GKLFPADSSQFQALLWSRILRQFCSDCHRPDAATPQTPYFASSDPAQAYGAAQPKSSLNTPSQWRFGARLRHQCPHCGGPAADLSLAGAIGWVSGWGIRIGAGGAAQASTSTSQRLTQMVQSSGEYSIEVWATPANVSQTDAYIVTYSGDNTNRNMTLGQHAMQYEARTRSSNTDNNGAPALLTSATGMFAQASLQHVVLTYDAVNGQQIYVNGKYTGDADPGKGGTVGNWDGTFALVLGNETTGQR